MECSKVQGDAGIYGSLLLGLLITFQETKQECSRDADGSGRGGMKFLSSEKSKEVIGVFIETDYSPIILGSSLAPEERSYSPQPLFLAFFSSFINLVP